MKKILAMAIGMAAVACIASAASETYSQNAVGFISISADAQELVPLTVPFVRVNDDTAGGLMEFADLQFATDAEGGSFAYFWNGSGWDSEMKYEDAGQRWDVDRQLQAGEFFFFKPKTAMTVVMAGEVPSDPTFDVAVAKGSGISAIGNPYPVPVAISKSKLGKDAQGGSFVYKWVWDKNTKKGSWVSEMKYEDAGDDWDTDYTFEPGVGFFFKGTKFSTVDNWDVTKPYDWP